MYYVISVFLRCFNGSKLDSFRTGWASGDPGSRLSRPLSCVFGSMFIPTMLDDDDGDDDCLCE